MGGAVVGLLFLSQLRIESLVYQFKQGILSFLVDPSLSAKDIYIVLNFVSPIRGIILWVSLIIVVFPIAQNIYTAFSNQASKIPSFILLQAALLFAVLCLMFKTFGISGLSEEYSNTSLVMFSKLSTVSVHQRLLMPALAHLLFFRGDTFYLIFSFLCAFILVYMVRLWFFSNNLPVSFWQLISLGTLSFIYFQILVPGYPDVLVGIFLPLAFTFDLSQRAKLSLFVLSLVSHEASLFIWFAAALILLDPKGFVQFLSIVGVYILFTLTINSDISEIWATRDVGGTSSLEWFFKNLDRELLGIFFGFKALWLVVLGAIVYLYKNKRHTEIFQILMIIGAGIAMTLFGVDTSRLFGWAFIAVLLSWKILLQAGGRWGKPC